MHGSLPAIHRSALLSLGVLLVAGCAAQPATAPPGVAPETEAEVLGAVQRLFDIMESRDTADARRLLLPEGAFFAVVAEEGEEARLRVMPHPELITALGAAPERWSERIWSPEVRVHGPIATVWTPYEFRRDDRVSHCGVNAFSLVHLEGEWRISGITYTVEPGGCPDR